MAQDVLTDSSTVSASPPASTAAPPKLPISWLVGIGLFLVVVGSGLMGLQLALSGAENPLQLIQGWSPTAQPTRVFAPGRGMTEAEASLAYKLGLRQLQTSQYAQSLETFRGLEPILPGLKDFVLLHEAEAHEKLPNEMAVQASLKQLLRERPASELKGVALYRLGQSYVRASQPKEASKAFEKLLETLPQSEYGIASLYYLYQLDGQNPSHATYPQQYLAKTKGEGRFALELAMALDNTAPNLTPEAHGWVGTTLAKQAKTPTAHQKALFHLSQAPTSTFWVELGRSQLKNKQTGVGLATLVHWIERSQSAEDIQVAVDMLVRNESATDAAGHLIQLRNAAQAKGKTVGTDYLLWKLAQIQPAQSGLWLDTLLAQYPKSDYAPESSWQRLWPLFEAGRFDAFMSQANTHVARYPYANSTPAVLFWQGKIFEKQGNLGQAKAAYDKASVNYPTSYYAYRAKGRLTALSGGKDPGWFVKGSGRPYPPQKIDELPGVADDLIRLSPPTDGLFSQRLQMLAKVGAVDDLALLMEEKQDRFPVILHSWQAHQQGALDKSIRLMRDELSLRARQGNMAGHRPSPAESRLVYPLPYTVAIEGEAAANQLDPYLAQALMREESYFNPLATSSSNAMGLMQLLPATAAETAGWVGLRGFTATQLYTPAINIKLGCRYLGHLHQLFNGNSMLAVGAYNGGPNAMKRWVAASSVLANDPDLFVEQIPYAQSRDYIKKVFASYWNYERIYATP